ncbi:MAG TPA: PEGA domain-containing protein [Vicinamibacterales bacterium]|nr:PEGA domain-containing protein [Vicinamibacterales bacterium]
MTPFLRLATTMLVAIGLTAPPAFADQARPRPAGSSSAGSSGSSSGSSTGSAGAGRSTSGVGSGTAARSSGSDEQARPRPAGSSTTGRATSRSTPPPAGGSGSSASRPGGSSSGPGGSASAGSSRRTGNTVSSGRSAIVSGTRDRGNRAVTGSAARRDLGGIDVPLFGPWGRWFPYYGTSWGPSFGFVAFNPWGIWGATSWQWGRHGYWYDPYGYYPYSGYGYYGGGGSYARSAPADEGRLLGSIRLKASPKTAMVYIDGALVGTVDDFDGLSDHLKLDAGTYELELRATGYETYTGELVVEPGKTLTERVSLKKIN